MTEVIKHAAVRSKDGMIFLGKCHADCFHQGHACGVKMSQDPLDQGFFTNLGRYVTRTEAAQIAIAAKQVSEKKTGVLFSEELWSEREGGQFSYSTTEGYTLKEGVLIDPTKMPGYHEGCSYLAINGYCNKCGKFTKKVEPVLGPDEIKVIRHTVGADSRQPGFRNRFCTEVDNPVALKLVELGFFKGPFYTDGSFGENCGLFFATPLVFQMLGIKEHD